MNLCLTTECNNHCPYCFQKALHECVQQMTVDDVNTILEWSLEDLLVWQENISLLGGEPTCHPQLIEILQLIRSKSETIGLTLISNLLCSNTIIQSLNTVNNVQYLLNISYDHDKENLFLSNLKELKNKENICLSITLSENRHLNQEYITRLRTILNQYPLITRIRIGLREPNPDEAWSDIYNYEEDLDLLFDQINITQLTMINFDCPINYCQMSESYYRQLIQNPCVNGLKRKCSGPALDILPSFTAKYCYSTPDQYNSNNIFTYPSHKQLRNTLIAEGVDNYLIENNKCKNCTLYLQRKCTPCRSIDLAMQRGEKNE